MLLNIKINQKTIDIGIFMLYNTFTEHLPVKIKRILSMVTMADVARKAGVTKQSVSNVLAGKPVRPETWEKVITAVKELGYTPNLVARALARGKTNLISLVVPTLKNPFYAEIAEEVEQTIDEFGYQFILSTTRNDLKRSRQQFESLTHRAIDGMLLAEDHYSSYDAKTLSQRDFPIVLYSWESLPYPDNLSVVSIDFRQAGFLAASHLLELGHRNCGVIYENPTHQLRLSGFLDAFRMSGIIIDEQWLRSTADASYESGYLQGKNILRDFPQISAIFATNDLMAAGVLDAAQAMGRNVPEDISIIGLDDITQSAHTRPPLTSISIPKKAMAREAVLLLLRSIEYSANSLPVITLLHPALVVRHSTGPI